MQVQLLASHCTCPAAPVINMLKDTSGCVSRTVGAACLSSAGTCRDYYNPDGSLRPTAATAEQLILKALKLQPKHPHALHLHVHIAEAGSAVADPGRESVAAFRGLRSAEQLAELPVQNGHLLHMPSHIFVRVGQYKKAVMVNKAAYDFDVARGQQCIIPYLPEHNVNLLVYAARCAGTTACYRAFCTCGSAVS